MPDVPLKVTINDKFVLDRKGLIFCLDLNDNSFEVIDNMVQIVGKEIEVEGKTYLIKEYEKFRCAHPVEWEERRPIAIVVEEI